MVKALVTRGAGQVLAVEDIELPAPGPDQVRVRVRAAGVCHSDLSMANGTLTAPFPLVLGHEAAGVVTEVGADVAAVAPGDHVVLNWSPACRTCWFCTHGEPWLCETGGTPAAQRGTTADGTPLHVTLGLGALAEEVVVPAHAVIRIPADVPLEESALLGCAVLTGVGAVRNTARVQAGDAVLVIGLGGVGLSVVTAARAAGADPVIAVDLTSAKQDLALSAGATHFLESDDTLSRSVRKLTDGRGVDHAFECVGRSATIRAAWRGTRRGGQVVVVGMGAKDDMLSLSALDIFSSARTLRSSVYGSADPDVEVPQLAASVVDGSLDLSPLVTHRITLAEAPAAFDRMARGEGARSLVVFD
jgi:S-(hydroxymethyl)glutathione dehydrogenase/alcohol dehydrogenase